MGAARCFGLCVRQFGSKLSAPGVSLSQVPEGMTSGRRRKKETSAALQITTYERPGEAITIQPDFLLKKKIPTKQTTQGYGKCKKTVNFDLEAAKGCLCS